MRSLHVVAKLWEEHTRANDTEVSSNEHIAQRHVRMELIDRGCDDVRATCRTIVQEHGSQRDTCQHTANNHRHKVLSLAHQLERQSILLFRKDILRKSQHEIEREDGKDSLHQEPPSQYLQRYHQQNAIDEDIGILQMESCGIVDDS